jgi:hypothetical protein
MSPSRSGPFEFTVMVDSFRVGSGRHRSKAQPCRPDLSYATHAGWSALPGSCPMFLRSMVRAEAEPGETL